MPAYKVTYFDFSGSRGEEVRLALSIAGLPFEDNRLDRAAFAAMKPGLPFGSLPTLEIEGHGTFGQSNAILRLIGRQNGLYPEDLYEAARHDALMDAAEDLRHRISPTMRMPDGPDKVAARQQLAAEYLPLWGTCVERALTAASPVGPFVMGTKIGVADLKLYMVHRWISSGAVDHIPGSVLAPYARLNRLAEAVRAHPAVAAWSARAA